jgi:hypothetical protein
MLRRAGSFEMSALMITSPTTGHAQRYQWDLPLLVVDVPDGTF